MGPNSKLNTDLLKPKPIEEEEKLKDFSFLSSPDDEQEYLQQSYDGTLKQGLSTGCDELDNYFRFKEGNFVVINGHDNVGKSTVIWYLAVISNLLHGWKWIFFTAENRDAGVRKRLIEFRYGKDYNKLNPMQIEEGKAWAYENFAIIKAGECEDYKSIIAKGEKCMESAAYKGMLIDPYNSLEVSLKGENKGLSTHDFHYSATGAFRRFCKNFNCSVYLNCHAVTSALRTLDAEGYPAAPNKADTEGGGKFANRADDFITIHRLTQHPDQYNYTQLHIRKIKETETGGKPTPLAEPVYLKMENNGGFFGFYNKAGRCSIQDVLANQAEPEQTELEKPDAEYKADNHWDFEPNTDFYNQPQEEEIPPF